MADKQTGTPSLGGEPTDRPDPSGGLDPALQGEAVSRPAGKTAPPSSGAKKKGNKASMLPSYAIICASVVVVLGGIHLARAILAPIFLATFFSLLLAIPCNWFQRKLRLSKVLSLCLVSLMVLCVGFGTMTILKSQLTQFTDRLPYYSDRFNKTLNDIPGLHTLWKEVFSSNKEGAGEATGLFPAPSKELSSRLTSQNDPASRNVRVIRPVSLVTPDQTASAGRLAPAENLAPAEGAALADDTLLSPSAANGSFFEAPSPPLEFSDTAAPAVEAPGPLPSDKSDAPAAADTPGTQAAKSEDAAQAGSGDSPPADPNADYPDTAPPGAAPTAADHHVQLGISSQEAVKTGSQILFSYLRRFSGELATIVSQTFIIMLLVIFMLIEASVLPEKAKAAFKRGDGEDGTEEREHLNSTTVNDVVQEIRSYISIKTAVSMFVGLFVTILLMIAQVQYPLLWGVIAFLLNFIPNIGSVAAAIPPILLATVDQGLLTGGIVTVGMILINCGMGFVVEPRWLGKGLNLSPLVILISLLFCGWILGPIGMFLSPPLAVIVKIILESFPETDWIATLMANKPPKEDEKTDPPNAETALFPESAE
ncbi:MAG: AI-2E family transporter [Thermoguttaceae bacterium]|nr:AI-2E family transporter [Thermoguttaceae bacterium]